MSTDSQDTTIWEGYDVVNKSLEKGILLTKDVVRFFKKRLEIEEVYCKSLQKAVQKFEPLVSNGFIGEQLAACWQEIRAETEVQASLHESMLSSMKEFICDPFENLVIDLEQKHKMFVSEGQKSLADTKESVAKLKKMKIGYDKLFRESMSAETAAGSGTASKRDTQRLQRRTLRLTHELIKADGDYKAQINETNAVQAVYVKEQIPKLMTVFNKMESVRLHIFKQYLIKYYTTIESLPHTFPNHKRNIIDLLNMTSGEEDISEFLNRNKDKIAPPKPFEYEPTADEAPPPTKPAGRPMSMQFSAGALSFGSSSKKEKELSPTTSPTITPKKSEPIATPTKKEGAGGFFNKTPSSKKETTTTSSSPPTSGLITSTSKKKDVGLQSSTSKGRENNSTSPPLSTSTGKEKESTKWWFRSKRHSQHDIRKKHPVFGAKLEDIMADQKQEHPDLIIPYLLVVLRDIIVKMDGLRTEGIFRVPGNAIDVIAFKKQFDEGNYELVTDNVHTAAAMFKLWLREMPDPVFPYSVYDKCIAATTATARLATVNLLPEVNKNVLRFVVQLLREIAKNQSVTKMGIDNLAMVFAPCLLRSLSSDPSTLLENSTKEKEFALSIIEHLPMPSGNENSSSSIPPFLDMDPSTPPSHTRNTSSPSPSLSSNLSSAPSSTSSTPSTTPPIHNHLNHRSDLTSSNSSVEDDAHAPHTQAPRQPSLSAILEDDGMTHHNSNNKGPVAAVAKVVAQPVATPHTTHTTSLLDDGDTLQAPAFMVASALSPRAQPVSTQVKDVHRMRVQVRAESIAAHLSNYLQTLSQSEVSHTKMTNATKLLNQKLTVLDEFLHHLTPSTSHEPPKSDTSSPFIHLRPDFKVPPLPSYAAQDKVAKEDHAALVSAVLRTHEKLHELVCRAEVSNSADEVKATKKLLKSLKIDLVEKSLDEGEQEKPETNGTDHGTGEGGEEGEGEGEEIDGTDILTSLEAHVASKRGLLEANEDDLDANAIEDLTEKRMAFARQISPIKKELDQFCKECTIEVVPDARYPVDDLNSEVKFLRKMILHVIARICYLTKEGVSYIQQLNNKKEAKEGHERLASIVAMLA